MYQFKDCRLKDFLSSIHNSLFHFVKNEKYGCYWCLHHHYHHHVVLVARISLTLSCHFSLSFIASGRSSGQNPVSSHSCWMYFRAGRPAFAWPCVGVHNSTSLMSSSLLLQQCPACLVRLTWIVFVIGGRTQFLPGSGRIDTAIWMHYMDSNKTAGEEARWQLHKNAASNLEQVLAGNIPQDTNCTATCLLSRKLFKLDEPDVSISYYNYSEIVYRRGIWRKGRILHHIIH